MCILSFPMEADQKKWPKPKKTKLVFFSFSLGFELLFFKSCLVFLGLAYFFLGFPLFLIIVYLYTGRQRSRTAPKAPAGGFPIHTHNRVRKESPLTGVYLSIWFIFGSCLVFLGSCLFFFECCLVFFGSCLVFFGFGGFLGSTWAFQYIRMHQFCTTYYVWNLQNP